jgi:hypothetical protein
MECILACPETVASSMSTLSALSDRVVWAHGPFAPEVAGREYLLGRRPNMSNSGIIGACVGIFSFIGSMLGSLEHAYKADPSFVHQAHVAVHGVVILPFRD